VVAILDFLLHSDPFCFEIISGLKPNLNYEQNKLQYFTLCFEIGTSSELGQLNTLQNPTNINDVKRNMRYKWILLG